MTNQLAIILGVVIVSALAVDIVVFDAEGGIFLAKKLMELTEYIAFWR